MFEIRKEWADPLAGRWGLYRKADHKLLDHAFNLTDLIDRNQTSRNDPSFYVSGIGQKTPDWWAWTEEYRP